MKCEWCGQNYPEQLESGELYYMLKVFDTTHTICSDCYSRLDLVVSVTEQNKRLKK